MKAMEADEDYMNEKPVDAQISTQHEQSMSLRAETIKKNRSIIGTLFGVITLLGRLMMPFRSHDESPTSTNRGLFVEFVHHMAKAGHTLLKDHLLSAPLNATYLSPTIQNQMISIVGDRVRRKVKKLLADAFCFSIMMDETRDTSHVDQVVIVLRFVRRVFVDGVRKVIIEERMFGLVAAFLKTGEALTGLVLKFFEEQTLFLDQVVGQCYDGGSNFSGIYKGVQARIRELNPLAIFSHCFAHSLNRVCVNAMNHKTIPGARNFFTTLEHLVVFISSGHRYHTVITKFKISHI